MQYVYLNAFDLFSGVFYSRILLLNMAFYYTFTLLQGRLAAPYPPRHTSIPSQLHSP